MKHLSLILISMMSFNVNVKAQNNLLKPIQKQIKVYLLGTFHFAQTDSTYDVLDKHHQKSLNRLAAIIARQKPEKIFVERQPEFEFKNKQDSLYKAYVNGAEINNRNEIFQLGFRVAKILGHKKVYQCDNPGMYGKYYRPMKKYAKENGQMDVLKGTAKGTVIGYDDLVDEDSVMNNSTLLEYIQWINSEFVLKTSHAFYTVNCPQISSRDFYNYDDDDTMIGADLMAEWYRRNIMIYTKMINQLDYAENAIFLLMGSDHIPVIASFFESNPYFKVMNAEDWLK